MITKDLEGAITLLEYDVAQHVAALAAARAAILDTAVIDALTARVIAVTQTLARSEAPQDYAVPATPVVAPAAVLPAFLLTQSALGPVAQPSVAESIAAALANTPK